MPINHPAAGCTCPQHEAKRAYHRRYRAEHPKAVRDAQRILREGHVGCYCHQDCLRNRIETAIARGLTPSQIMARTGCDYATYRAVLHRMSVAA